jgi:uncharacterized Zn-finger protein
MSAACPETAVDFLTRYREPHQERNQMVQSASKGREGGQRVVKVSRGDLPLSCPLPEDEIWNMHPRVYLPIEKSGEATCPYCGARYVLED